MLIKTFIMRKEEGVLMEFMNWNFFRREKCFPKKMGCPKGHFRMDGKAKAGYTPWGSQSVGCSGRRWTPKGSRRTSSGVGKLRPSIVCPLQ